VRATASATPWALGLLKRSQALMADDSLAEEMFQQSIAYLQQTLVLIDLALAQLSYGEWLRRHQRRIDARAQLRQAHEAFQSMGATGFAERARSELLATGEHAIRRSVETKNDLTPQELKIAQLASRGQQIQKLRLRCSLAPVPSITTCARSSESWTSRHAVSWNAHFRSDQTGSIPDENCATTGLGSQSRSNLQD